jgi:hypothetical protein
MILGRSWTAKEELELKQLVFDRIVKAKELINTIASFESDSKRQDAVHDYYGEKLSNIITIISANPFYLQLRTDNKELVLPFLSHLEIVISIKQAEKKGHYGPLYIAFPSYGYVRSPASTKDLDLYEPIVEQNRSSSI